MAKFVIEGGKRLSGQITVSGSKNASLKMLPACILTEEKCSILNVADITDIRTMIQIIKDLGGIIERKNSELLIDTSSLKSFSPSDRLVGSMRASVVIVGPLLARFGRAEITEPGGCLIGARSIDTHIDAFKQMGVKVTQKNNHFYFEVDKLKGQTVILREMSVTATENIMMLATKAEGETEIRVAAAEPEIEDLANFLNKMGAKIQGAGTHTIKIKGIKKLKGAVHRVIPDRIEAGTLAIAAAVSKGHIEIKNIIPSHLDLLLTKFKDIGVNFSLTSNSLIIQPSATFKPIYIDTRPYPGFSTDLQAPMAVLLTQAKGTSRIFETLFESRFNYVKELINMGASATIPDPHTLIIKGQTPLHGAEIECFDLRAGATLVIAALIAKGESVVKNVELIDRGYEKLEERLKNIGANIERVS